MTLVFVHASNHLQCSMKGALDPSRSAFTSVLQSTMGW
jgi:hypothetical protein